MNRDCPGCGAPATHATARPGLRLCAPCWARMIEALKERREVAR